MPFINANFLKSIVKVYKKEQSCSDPFSYRFSAADFHGPGVYCNYANEAALIGRRKDGAG